MTAMKRRNVQFPEILYIFSFLLYLFGSSLALIQHGIELSLWLMTFAVVISAVTTLFPLAGIRWLVLDPRGSRSGRIIAWVIQLATWITFGYAMLMRLSRDLDRFYTMITVTTLLWAAWLILLIYSRHACRTRQPDDTLKEDGNSA